MLLSVLLISRLSNSLLWNSNDTFGYSMADRVQHGGRLCCLFDVTFGSFVRHVWRWVVTGEVLLGPKSQGWEDGK